LLYRAGWNVVYCGRYAKWGLKFSKNIDVIEKSTIINKSIVENGVKKLEE
jgi:hypothetical protein